jgi:hypothetical protein
MRTILIIFCCLLWACQPTPPKNRPALDEDLTKDSASGDHRVSLTELFTLEDAEKIMGEPAVITDSSNSGGKTGNVYQSAYKAVNEDPNSKKTGTVYFLANQFVNEDFAKQDYASIKTANQDNGIEELDHLGDEAYFHTDGENFYYIMVRKGVYGFRIKVNKITSKTSKDALMKTAERITEKL